MRLGAKMSLDAEVVVVGGSVAGATVAAFLGGRGRSVVVLDRARFPRDKPCGEGVMPHGVDVLAQLGLHDALLAAGARPLNGVRYTVAGGASAMACFPPRPGSSAVALGVRRTVLDRLLLDRARAARDVCVLENFAVRSLVREDGRLTGVTDGERVVRGGIVVGADGLRSTLRRALGWEAPRGGRPRYAVVGHFRLGEERLPPVVDVVFADGVESYLTPLGNGEALVALLVERAGMRRFAGDLAGGYLRTLRALPHVPSLLAGAELLPGVRATGPFAVRARRVAGGNALLIGDAAGFRDPITGEGMASALLQARAAARVIDAALAAGDAPDLSPFSAEHRLTTTTGDRLTRIALLLAGSGVLRRRAVVGLRRRDGLLAKLLAVNSGHAGLGSLSPRDWLALTTGI